MKKAGRKGNSAVTSDRSQSKGERSLLRYWRLMVGDSKPVPLGRSNMTTAKPNPAPTGQPNPTLTELKALREEVAALRAQLSKPLNITDQVAKGVVIAGFFWLGLAFVFSLLVSQF